jgi:tape measure domain-containing protein
LGTEGLSRITRAMGQIQSKGKLMAQDVNQLAEAGIPVWDILAQSMGKTKAEVMSLSEDGLVPAEEALAAIEGYMDMKFSGVMEAQSKTLLGTIENIQEALKLGFAADMQPFMTSITEGVRSLIPTLQGTSSLIAQNLGQALTQYLQGAKDAIAQIIAEIGPLFSSLTTSFTPAYIDLTNGLANFITEASGGIKEFGRLLADSFSFLAGFGDDFGNMFSQIAYGLSDVASAASNLGLDEVLETLIGIGSEGPGALQGIALALNGLRAGFLALQLGVANTFANLFDQIPGMKGVANALRGEADKIRAEIGAL